VAHFSGNLFKVYLGLVLVRDVGSVFSLLFEVIKAAEAAEAAETIPTQLQVGH